LGIGHLFLRRPARVLGRALLPFGVEGDDLLVQLVGLVRVIAVAVLAGQLEDGFDVLRILRVESLEALERVDPLEDLVDLFLEFFGGGIVAQDPIELRSVGVEEQDRGRGPDLEPVEDGFPVGFLGGRLEEDEILGQVILILGVFEELLTEQFATPSGVGVEIEEKLLSLGLGLGHGLIERPFGEGIGRLGEGDGGENKKRGHNGDFFHAHLLPGTIA